MLEGMSLRRTATVLLTLLVASAVAGVALVMTDVVPGPAWWPTSSRPAAGQAPEVVPPSTSPSPTGSPAATPTTPVAFDYVFPIARCEASYGKYHHNYPAADIFAERGCAFVAPVDGRIDYVNRKDTWDPATNEGAARGGLSVAFLGIDGVRYYGSHLERVREDLKPGMVVTAGDRLGRVGDSGSALGTGTHLHFGISWPTEPDRWWVRRGTVMPQPFLDAWRKGKDRSPVDAVSTARRKSGDERECRTYC